MLPVTKRDFPTDRKLPGLGESQCYALCLSMLTPQIGVMPLTWTWLISKKMASPYPTLMLAVISSLTPHKGGPSSL